MLTTVPTITCPAAQTLVLNATCAGVLADYTSLATVADNCTATGALTVTQSPVAGSAVSGVGTTVVTLTVTDASSNTASCTFNVNRVDTTVPTITCPAAQTLVLNATCAGVLADYTSLATVADNCTATGALTVTQSPVAGSAVSGVGTTVVTLTVTDASSNSANCTFNVNRVDTTVPTITCPAAQTLVLNATCAGVLADYTSLATVADNCTATGALTVTQSPVAGSAVSGVGTTVVTLTVTDASSNTASCTFNVNRVDTTVPTITCPAAQTLVLNSSCAGVLADYRSLATVADNCTATGALTVTQSPAAGTAVSGVGTTVVTLTVTDASSNSANCTFNVNRVDTTVPTITCPAAQTLVLNATCAGVLADYTSLATVADNCTATGALTVTQSPVAGSAVSGVGTTVVTLTVTDASSNTASCTFNVNRVDTTVPTITCPAAQTLVLNATCAGVLADYRSLATVADNCTATGALTVTQSPVAGSAVSGVGTTVVTLTVTDASSNTASCTFNVNRVDTTVPTITCPANISTPADAGFSTATIAVANPAVSDNCVLASLTWTISGATSGTSPLTGMNYVGTQSFNIGITTIDYVLTDASGNSSNCSFTITVTDNQAPVITCPADTTVFVNAGLCTATVTLPVATATDNEGILSIINDFNNTSDASDTYPLGVTTIIWTATDNTGNTNTCQMLLTVADNQNPTITCPANISVNVDAGTCVATVASLGTPTTGDNCSVASVTNNHPSTTYSLGTTTVIWTVTDGSGNTATCNQTVTVTDNINPTITCPANISVNVDAGTCVATVASLGTPTTGDNCSVASVTNNHPSTTYSLGTTTVIWTVTDGSGNTATCNQTVTVTDNINPTNTCPANISVNVDAGTCVATVASLGTPTTGDNCSVASVTNNHPSTTYSLGTTTVIWTVTDGSGNTATCNQTVTVTDNINPTITCPANISVNVDPGTCVATVASLGTPTTGDNCSVASVTNNHPSTTYSLGTTSVIWTVTDGSGNTATCNQTVTVTDNINPTITCPANISVNVDPGTCVATVASLGTPTTGDNCSVASVTNNHPSTTYSLGTTTVIWTVTDGSGNTATCNQTVTVTDNINPTITCPANISVNVDAGTCVATVASLGTPTTGDNCNVASVTNNYPSTTYSLGTTTVIWTVTDGSGNTATCNQTVTVTDNINPTITCPANISVNVDAGTCVATVASLGTPTTGDNCSVASVTNNHPSTTYSLGTTTVIWTVTDGSGNTATCNQTVTVTDNINPTITCPADITAGTDNGECFATLIIPAPTTNDNCSVASVVNSITGTNNASGVYAIGTTSIIWTVTDGAGNMATCTQTVTVNDDEDPTIITCPSNQNVSSNAACQFVIGDYTALAAATDNCDASVTITQSPLVGTVVNGTTTVTITATDDAANTSTCTFQLIVTDNTSPIITVCAPDTTEQVNGSCNFTLPSYTSLVTASDNCDPSLTLTQSPVAGTVVSGHGTVIPVIITATDDNGNLTTCTFNVTLEDSIDPTITCPANITVNASIGLCTANVVVPAATTADNCAVASVTNDFNGTSIASGTYPLGTTTVNWTVVDIAGNTAACSMTVTVIDNQNPTITCPANISVNVDAGTCVATVASLGTPTTGDNCSVASVTNNHPSTTYSLGTTTVIWTVTDGSGNTATCNQTVTVTDNINPTITCPANISVNVNAGTCVATVASLGTPTTGDNCSVASVTNNHPSTTYSLGTTTVIWTVTDGSGNTATCNQTVTVTDNINPTITCPANISVNVDAGTCVATVASLGTPTTGDNCSVASVTNNHPSTTYSLGTTTVIWTVTDGSGNTATCNQTVTVTDNINPTITCPANISVNVDAGTCVATVASLGTPTTGDNCSVASVTNNHPSTTYSLGTTTVIWTVTDGSGNTATCNQTVTVTDNINPTITCPANITISAEVGVCTASVTVPVPTTADNCTVASVVNDFNNSSNASDVYPVGTTTILWTVTDGSGNTANCSMTVTVTDNQNPTITCPANVAIGTDDSDCTATVTIAVPATADNCSVASVVNSFNGTNNASGIYPIGTTVVTWTVTDVNGNITTCTQNVVVSDDEDPIITTCPPNQNVSANATCQFVVADYTSLAVATDNCDASVTITQSPLVGTVVNGTTTVTITATDDAANTSTCTFQLIVTDNTAPIITVCAPDTTEQVNGACNFTLPSYTSLVTASDNCDPSLTLTQSPVAGTVVSGHGTVIP
ncbi:MAG: HYR domain-containing protein [Flavobacteriales bacterium]|nr:HYR domain-containing protein [Flavobacteriales bacterium]